MTQRILFKAPLLPTKQLKSLKIEIKSYWRIVDVPTRWNKIVIRAPSPEIIACHFLFRKAEELSESFDIVLMGDMFFDQHLGHELSNLAKFFKAISPQHKRVFIGDPGRWYLSSEQQPEKSRLGHLEIVAKYDLGPEIQQEHFGLVSGFVYEVK